MNWLEDKRVIFGLAGLSIIVILAAGIIKYNKLKYLNEGTTKELVQKKMEFNEIKSKNKKLQLKEKNNQKKYSEEIHKARVITAKNVSEKYDNIVKTQQNLLDKEVEKNEKYFEMILVLLNRLKDCPHQKK
jgi:hypothetical protein